MTPNELTIKRFEYNYPYLLDIIKKFELLTIENNLPALTIIIENKDIPNLQEPRYDSNKDYNLRYKQKTDLSDAIGDYLLAIGYPAVSCGRGDTSLVLKENVYHGFKVIGFTKVPEDVKK